MDREKPSQQPNVIAESNVVKAQSQSSSGQMASSHNNIQKVVSPNVDDELVMKCLSDNVNLDSKYKIALFDFGGQSVFNVIHPFFLTQYGVYIVVFNMEWILGSEGKRV